MQEKEGTTAKAYLDGVEQCLLTKLLELKNMTLQKEEAFRVQGTNP